MIEEKRIAEVGSYDELIDALRMVMVERRLTVSTLDYLTGLQSGYSGKLLGLGQVKRLGPISMGLVLQALGVKLLVVEDTATLKKMQKQYEQRERPARDAYRVSTALIERVTPTLFRNLAVKATEARKRIPSSTRRRIARQAAKARWGKKARRR